MDNLQIYKKTLGFSIRRVLWDLLTILLLAGLSALGFIVAAKINQPGWIGLLIGLILGIVAAAVILRFVSYRLKAAQIAMMTRGVTEGTLPEDVIGEGKQIVKERFVTVAAYFAVTNVIKGIFNQIGRGITKVGESIGGNVGGTIGSTVSSVIQTVISYLCDCCLGWVFYRKEIKATKATCEGAVIFFKHGKTLAKNMGRVFGIGLISLLLIGGAFFGIIYLILSSMGNLLAPLYADIARYAQDVEGTAGQILQNPATLPIVFSALGGLLMWGAIHSTFVKPFVLVGVLRNYMASGVNDIPTEESFAVLDSKSKKFAKLHSEL